MPRDKSKAKKVLGKPKTKTTIHKKPSVPDPITPPPETPPASQPTTVRAVRGRCFDCDHCNVSITNVGFCKHEEIRKILGEWDGVIQYPQKFSCIYHS